jgi:hypothetical protein
MTKDLIRSSQLLTAFGPGAMVDLPEWSVIVGGLEHWIESKRRRIEEPRLIRKLPHPCRGLKTPPLQNENPYGPDLPGLRTFVFPTWFVTAAGENHPRKPGARRRRLVQFGDIDKRKRSYENKPVVPVRFVAACVRGHVDDVNWRTFVHGHGTDCDRPLWLIESGASGEVKETWVECACGAERRLYDAVGPQSHALGRCRGRRPWLSFDDQEKCDQYNKLLVRTASNAYFPVIANVLSIPHSAISELQEKIATHWADLSRIKNVDELKTMLHYNSSVRKNFEGTRLDVFMNEIENYRCRKTKPEEFDILRDHESPPNERINPEAPFVSEALPLDEAHWSSRGHSRLVEKVVLVHRLREVTAQIGFTRFEPITADLYGELDVGVQMQELSRGDHAYPAIELRGEGVFLAFDASEIEAWLGRPEVQQRQSQIERGLKNWIERTGIASRKFPGAPYIALHTLSHLLMSEIAMECGYPLASLKERIYATPRRYGILVYTATPGFGGTLGGLIEAGRRIGQYVTAALERAALCSSDPVCAEHDPATESMGSPLSGAACHSCVLVPESSCENRNDFLDRALLVDTLSHSGAGLFSHVK